MKKDDRYCPDHGNAPMMVLDDGFRRCAPMNGGKCKFTLPPKGGR